MFFFFFKQKTAYEMRISDWSSDVCSSDLLQPPRARPWHRPGGPAALRHGAGAAPLPGGPDRGRNAPSSLSGAGPHAQAPPPLQLGPPGAGAAALVARTAADRRRCPRLPAGAGILDDSLGGDARRQRLPAGAPRRQKGDSLGLRPVAPPDR